MATAKSAASELARRLRHLREHHWRGITITQRDLARALGGVRPLSVPLISSWENMRRPTTPPPDRLRAYATFFATRRSVEEHPYRIIAESELSPSERTARDRLERELMALRDRVRRAEDPRAVVLTPDTVGDGPLYFGDGNIITIVCAEVPPVQRAGLPDRDDPDRAFAELYSFADADALIELYGHVRATNPTSEVVFRKAHELAPDDYTTHMIVLGGIDWNAATSKAFDALGLPVHQLSTRNGGGFMVRGDDGEVEHRPVRDAAGRLVSDVGHFVQGLNPFNHKRILTMCNGSDGRGVLGVVRSLTDGRFRNRNADYLRSVAADHTVYSLLLRVVVVDAVALTPDWTNPRTRLHEWPT